MDLYYGFSNEGKIVLEGDEANHLVNVKRARIGEVVNVTDGRGQLFSTEIIGVEKHTCTLNILETSISEKKSFYLHIAVAPTKSIERIEWFLEKATETGIDEISFLLCRHSERKEIKPDRLNRVVISAMKQSVKTFLPKLNPMEDIKSFVAKQVSGTKLICSANALDTKNIKDRYQPNTNLVALIGPEGDFHADEISLAKEFNFLPATLGTSRLRTETAALNVCTIFNFINSQ